MKKLYQRKNFLNPLIFIFLAVILVNSAYAATNVTPTPTVPCGDTGTNGKCGGDGGCGNTSRCTYSGIGWECIPDTGCGYVPGEPTEGAGQPASFKLDLYPDLSNLYDLAKGKSVETFIGILYRIALPIAVVLGMLMVGVAGIGLMTSEGDPSKAMNAKDQLSSAIIGLLFVMLGVGVLRALISTLFTDTPQIGL